MINNNHCPHFWLFDDDETCLQLNHFVINKICSKAFVKTFSKEDELIKAFQTETAKPNFLLLDLLFQKTSGLEIASYLNEKGLVNENVHIYILSASIDSKEIAEVKQHDLIKAFIPKPLYIHHLKQIVESYDSLSFSV